uniref:Uncharacterized protein n=1 Tax=Arundo donax TaxID=35708 RepID=A0A0A9AAH2_ARUDO
MPNGSGAPGARPTSAMFSRIWLRSIRTSRDGHFLFPASLKHPQDASCVPWTSQAIKRVLMRLIACSSDALCVVCFTLFSFILASRRLHLSMIE